MAKETTLVIDYNNLGRYAHKVPTCKKCNKKFKDGEEVVKRVSRRERRYYHEKCWRLCLY